MIDFSKIYVLAEDERQQRFVRRYLYQAGFGRHVIDPEGLPQGRGGAGEHWVRQHYAAVVKKFRRRAAKAKTALIVVIDADTEEIGRRVRQLEETLGKAARQLEESIVHFIPRRNIETWILHLNGEAVNEVGDYRSRDVDDLIPSAAAMFHQWNAQPPGHCVPSLLEAFEETKRLT